MIFLLFLIFSPRILVAQKSTMDMVKAAKQEIENLVPEKVMAELAKGNVVLIDIREPEELKQAGKISFIAPPAADLHLP